MPIKLAIQRLFSGGCAIKVGLKEPFENLPDFFPKSSLKLPGSSPRLGSTELAIENSH